MVQVKEQIHHQKLSCHKTPRNSGGKQTNVFLNINVSSQNSKSSKTKKSKRKLKGTLSLHELTPAKPQGWERWGLFTSTHRELEQPQGD